jgi:hypothetical protein
VRAALNLNVRTLVRLAAPYCRPRTPFASPPPRRAGANHLVLLADLRRSSFMACTITSLIAFAAFGILAVGFANLPRFSTRLREAASRRPARP